MNTPHTNYWHQPMQPDVQENNIDICTESSDKPENVWPNKFPPRINDSNYTFMILLKVLVMSISGIIFLLLFVPVNAITWAYIKNTVISIDVIATLIMNLGCLGIVLLVIHLIKIKITGTSNDVSISLLLRYYDLCVICMVILYLSLMYCTWERDASTQFASPYDDHMNPIAQILFYCSLGIVMVLSVIMALYRGTLRERCMRFFFMWPLKDEQSDSKKPDKLLHILWIVRQLFQAFVIGYTMMASGLIMEQFKYQKKHLYLEYNAIRAFFQAAFLEEYFKFFIAASVPFIAKYSQSKSAILHVSIMVGLAFSCVEDIQYCMGNGLGALIRLLMFPLHFVFAYPAAVAITRQRDSIVWIFEVIGSFLIGVAAHGIYDYLLFIPKDNPDLIWCALLSVYGLGGLFIFIGIYILWKNPFLPKDELKDERIETIPQNYYHHNISQTYM